MRLFKTLLLLMLLASLIPLAILGWVSVSDTREMLVRDSQELAQERVKQLRMKVERKLEEPVRAVTALARVPDFFGLPRAEQRSHVAAVLNQRRELLALTAFSPSRERISGLQAFAVSDLSPTEVAAHEARAQALIEESRGDVEYSDVVRSTGRNELVMTLAFPVGDPVKGYIAAEVSLESIAGTLANERIGSNGFVYVSDARGQLIAAGAGAEAELGEKLDQRAPVQHLFKNAALMPRGVDLVHVGNFGAGDEERVAAYAVLPQTGWAIVSEQPITAAYAQADSMVRKLLVFLVGGSLLALVLAAIFSRRVTRPLKNFTAASLELAQGKFGVQVQVDVGRKNELGELAQTYNYMSQQLLAYDAETKRLYESLEEGYLQTIIALANSIDSKDSYTRGHSQRVADVSVEIGKELGLTERELKHLQYGGILHDVGKIGIIEPILCKQSRLTDEEMQVMRQHPEIGDSIIAPITFLQSVRSAIRNHHERWDGSGYPDKLKGEEIPMLARIVGCADTFDACTSTRPYQKAMPLETAMGILEKLSGSQLDPQVVSAMKRVLEKKGVRIEGSRQPVKLAS